MLGLGGELGLGEIFGLRDIIVPREEVRLANNFMYLLTGLLFFFLGFRRINQALRNQMIGGVGILYLLSTLFSAGGTLLFLSQSWDLYSLGYDFERATLGILFLLVAKVFSPREQEVSEEDAHSSAATEDP